eukprot:COSAG04_NODE_794_length_10264_cov_35.102804_6_plen_72_part_00
MGSGRRTAGDVWREAVEGLGRRGEGGDPGAAGARPGAVAHAPPAHALRAAAADEFPTPPTRPSCHAAQRPH